MCVHGSSSRLADVVGEGEGWPEADAQDGAGNVVCDILSVAAGQGVSDRVETAGRYSMVKSKPKSLLIH